MKIIKAYGDWCAPCRVLSTKLDGFDKCPIENLNIDLELEKTLELNIRSVPTLILFNDKNEELWRHSGVIDKIQLENVVRKYETT